MYDSLSTPNFPALRFALHANVTAPANQFPDAGDGGIVVPLKIKSYTLPAAKTAVNTIQSTPIIDGDVVYGGKTLSKGASELTKTSFEGYIDTPCTQSGTLLLPTLILEGNAATYADMLAAFYEGRLGRNLVRPTWFRDPFGRVYNSPRILDYSASYIEQYPGRTNFSISLKT